MALLATFLTLIHIACATLTITFPINSQVPPVARASEQFEFIFSDSTFTSSEPSISYSLVDPPGWLRLDGRTRTFSGTPAASDVGMSVFGLTALDGSGSVSMRVTLVVTKDVGITLGTPILPQLEQFGATSSPATLFLYPSDPFSFEFSPDTFVGTSKGTIFYAVSANSSPLPSWLYFDPQALTFSGLTPPIVSSRATPEPFAINLIASDYPGFSSAVAPFQLLVASHVIAFNRSSVEFVISKGGQFTSPSLRDNLFIDGRPAEPGQFMQMGGNLPYWLSLDRDTLTLSGTPPDDTKSENVTIPVIDTHGDIANITVSLIVQNVLFNRGALSTTATIGRDFNYTIDRSILNGTGVGLDLDLGQASSWLTYNHGTMKLSGLVPRNLSPQNVILNLGATKGKISETEPFVLSLVRGSGPLPPSTMSSSQASASPSALSRSSHATTGSSTSSRTKTTIIVVSTSVPVLGFILVCLLLAFYLKRRKRHRRVSDQPISLPQPLMTATNNAEENEASLRSARTDFQRLQTPPRVPTINLGQTWTHDTLRRSRLRASRLLGDEGHLNGLGTDASFMPPHAMAGDGPGFVECPQPVFNRQSQDLTPLRRDNTNYSRKRSSFCSIQSRDLDASSIKKRESRALSKASSRLSGPTLDKRVSGFGHGAGGLGPPGYGNVRRSWRDTKSLLNITGEERKDRSVDSILWSFPQPPTSGASGANQQKRASIRLVSNPSLSRLSHVSQLPDYIRHRAQTRHSNPLFSAGVAGSMDRLNRSPMFSDINWNQMCNTRRQMHRSYSQSSSTGPPVRPAKNSSRRNLGARVSEGLVHFRSEISLSGNGRFDSAESDDLSDEHADIVESLDSDGRHRWFQGSNRPGTQGLEISGNWGWEKSEGPVAKSQSLQSKTADTARTQRFSPLAAHPRDGSAFGQPPDEQRLRLFDERGRRPVSVDEGGLKRPIAGSQKGDIAFL